MNKAKIGWDVLPEFGRLEGQEIKNETRLLSSKVK